LYHQAEMGRRIAIVLYVVAMTDHSRCRCYVLQKPVLGTADSEHWNCLGVRSFLPEVPQEPLNEA
jgi:hypothetical protein